MRDSLHKWKSNEWKDQQESMCNGCACDEIKILLFPPFHHLNSIRRENAIGDPYKIYLSNCSIMYEQEWNRSLHEKNRTEEKTFSVTLEVRWSGDFDHKSSECKDHGPWSFFAMYLIKSTTRCEWPDSLLYLWTRKDDFLQKIIFGEWKRTMKQVWQSCHWVKYQL